jgi:predicted DNA-binding transcriptional regulator
MLEALGLDHTAERVYRLMLKQRQLAIADLCDQLTLSESQVCAALDELARLPLLRESREHPGRVRVVRTEAGLKVLWQQLSVELLSVLPGGAQSQHDPATYSYAPWLAELSCQVRPAQAC